MTTNDKVTISIPTYESRAVDYSQEEGSWRRHCPHCHNRITDGERLLVIEGSAIHVHCFTALVGKQTVDHAWLTIASQISIHPSRFKAAEIRAVLLNLIRMVDAITHARFSAGILSQVVQYRKSVPPDGGYITEVLVRNPDGTECWIPYNAVPEGVTS